MKVVYHPAVQQDVNKILQYYDAASEKLGDAFWDELQLAIQAAAETPERFHFATETLRRVNLRRFPYHFLFRMTPGSIRITVLRHHRRDPQLGLRRK